LVALLILGIAVLISNAKVETKNKELRSKLTETKKVDALEKRNQQLQKAVNDIEGVISRKTSWNSVLAGISSCMTSNLWITSIGVDKNNTMTVEGYSRNADYLLFEENMQRQLRFENVIVPSEKTMYQYGLQVHYFKLTCDILPDYKYNEKLRNLLNQPGSETEKAQEDAVPAAPGENLGRTLERSAAPEEKKDDRTEEIMETPMQGAPLRLGTPAGGTFRGSSKVAEEPPKAEGQPDAKPASKPARSARLMAGKKEASGDKEAKGGDPEASKETSGSAEDGSSVAEIKADNEAESGELLTSGDNVPEDGEDVEEGNDENEEPEDDDDEDSDDGTPAPDDDDEEASENGNKEDDK